MEYVILLRFYSFIKITGLEPDNLHQSFWLRAVHFSTAKTEENWNYKSAKEWHMSHYQSPLAIIIENQASLIKTLDIIFIFDYTWHSHIAALASSNWGNLESALRYGLGIWGSSPVVAKALLCQKRTILEILVLPSCHYIKKQFRYKH